MGVPRNGKDWGQDQDTDGICYSYESTSKLDLVRALEWARLLDGEFLRATYTRELSPIKAQSFLFPPSALIPTVGGQNVRYKDLSKIPVKETRCHVSIEVWERVLGVCRAEREQPSVRPSQSQRPGGPLPRGIPKV